MDIAPPYAYRNIVPLARTHKVVLPDRRAVPEVFQALNPIPVSFAEFVPAHRVYPLVFISGDEGKSFVAMAVVGLERDRNLFVLWDKTWDRRSYVPAYVRRYPFCMSRLTLDGKEQAERVVCVESAALADAGEALFDDAGEALPAWAQVQKFVFEYETDIARTEQMCRQLAELGLLEPFSLQAQPRDGESFTLTGMYRVAEAKLGELPPETLQGLQRNGVLARVHLHLASMDNFQALLDRRAAFLRRGAAPE
jgi:hypothetical protein